MRLLGLGVLAVLLVVVVGYTHEVRAPRASAAASATDQSTIFAYGDSLTEQDYTTALAALLPAGTVVHNEGVSGQSSGIIAARQGGVSVAVDAVTVPHEGSVVVRPDASISPWNTGLDAAVTIGGSLAGVPGAITRDAGTDAWLFTRSTAGPPVAVPAGTIFRPTDAAANASAVLISWVGRNDVVFDLPQPRAGIVAATEAMIDHLTPLRKKFLIISVTTTTTETEGTAGYALVRAINDELHQRWPAHFVDLRSLIIERGLEMAGIEPTAADRAAITADTVPPSLMVDAIHFNEVCRDRVIAPLIYEELRSRGWLSD